MNNNTVYCPKCNAPMTKRLASRGGNKGKYFWGCTRFPSCRGTRPYEPIKTNEDSEPQVLESIPKKIIYKEKKKQLYAKPYFNDFDVFFSQTCALPKEILEEVFYRNISDTDIKKISRFRIDIKSSKFYVNEKMQSIYSIALRMMTRGILTLNSEAVEVKLKNLFDYNENAFSIEVLDNYINYNKPLFNVDSERERFFIDEYLCEWLGTNWASHIMTQVSLDSIIDSDEISGQRVDFLISKDGINLVIELDGPEHEVHKDKDAIRDELLKACGYQVFRISNEDLGNPTSISLNKIKDVLKALKPKVQNVNNYNKFLIASKIVHQIQIALLKSLEQGYITSEDNPCFLLESNYFSCDEADKIMQIAIDDLNEVIENYCIIYGINNSYHFKNNNNDRIYITIGDGLTNIRQIIIRDIGFNDNIINEIGTFDGLEITNLDKHAIHFFLNYLFRFKEFQEGQLDAIERVLSKKDSIVLLPTGSGKSLIYQLTSLIVSGQTIVISPIISLMDDQIENLKFYGVDNCVAIYADIDRETINLKLNQMKNNENTITYLSPERLQIGSFRNDVKALLINNRIYTVAIDEAHCVSEWGHSFRTAYLNIGKNSRSIFRKGQDIPVIVALTGTASTAVLKDVKRELQISDYDAIITPKTFDRPELKYEIHESTSEGKYNVLTYLINNVINNRFNISRQRFSELNKEDTYSGIVFCPHTNGQFGINNIYNSLSRNTNLKIGSFSGQAPKQISVKSWSIKKKEVAEQFKRNQLNMLVATKAYGMGIDKSNIRFIIHYGIPGSIEAYYQEAGRAGRDKKNSKCIIIFSNDNNNDKILDATISLKQVHDYVKSLNYEQNDDISRMLYFHKEAFQGIDIEMNYTKKILSVIFENGYSELKRYYYIIADKTTRNNYEKAIQRLVVLGVLDDYIVDYSSNEYKLTMSELTKEMIIEKYCDYVKGYNEGRVKIEKEKLSNLIYLEIDKFVEASVRTLIEFVYDTIEKGRRRALKEIVQMSKAALTLSNFDDQDNEIRTRIVRYFESTYADIINEILEDQDLGFYKIKDIFEGTINEDGEQIGGIRSYTDAQELRGQVSRFLESTPDYPGLLFLRSLTECYTKEYITNSVIEDFLAAITFSKDRYSISDDTLNDFIAYGLNKIYERNKDVFALLWNEVVELLGKSIFETILNNDNINESLKLIPLMQYIDYQNNKILNMIIERKV